MVKCDFKYYKLTFFNYPDLLSGGVGYFSNKKEAMETLEEVVPERAFSVFATIHKFTPEGRSLACAKAPNTLMWVKR